jgi:hypothetical protein
MAENKRETLDKRVQKAILNESFFRWESAVIISLALILAVISNSTDFLSLVPSWIWLLGGAVAEGALVYSSITDPEFGRQVAEKLLHDDFHPERLGDKRLQQQMNEALDYRSRIEAAIREKDDTLLKDELSQTAVQIDEWLEHIYGLARRIDKYQQEQKILARDRTRAETRIQQLVSEQALETEPAVRAQIDVTLESMRRQLATLDNLENTIQRAALQLENSLSNLGTIYSQTMLAGAKDIDSSRARRLRHEIAEEVTELNDMLVAMDEVYQAEGNS